MVPPEQVGITPASEPEEYDSFSQDLYTEPFRNLYSSSQSLAALTRNKIFIEASGLSSSFQKRKLAADDQTDCESIVRYIADAKYGFVYSVKNHQVLKNEIPDMLEDTTPDFLFEEDDTIHIWNSLLAYHSFTATLAGLKNRAVVSFKTFESVDHLNLGQHEERASFWFKHSPEYIWTLMERTEKVASEFIKHPQNPQFPPDDAFVIGHFMAASAEIAHRIFDPVKLLEEDL